MSVFQPSHYGSEGYFMFVIVEYCAVKVDKMIVYHSDVWFALYSVKYYLQSL